MQGHSRKTAILVRCTREEADLIRKAAAMERRTLSGFVLNAVMNRIRTREALTAWSGQRKREESD